MRQASKMEQHIAVFGESGSGKTVLVSSFYGATQEPAFLNDNLFDVVADDIGEGVRLHRNYLGMRDSHQLPEATRFSSTSYSFSIKLRREPGAKEKSLRPFDKVQLVWHDYPGEWFEQNVSGDAEARRRVDTFRSLLRSDVALLLVDAQRLIDYAGEEERYLKSLFANFRNGLLRMKDDLLDKGKPLTEFPRIWILALSKADLLPGMDVFAFRDLVIEKASEEIELFRQAITGLIADREALSVGEDFLLLSSAKFEPDNIEVSERIGLDLVLPIAALLPFERHARWNNRLQLSTGVATKLLGAAAVLAPVLLGRKYRWPAKIARGAAVMTVAAAGRTNTGAKVAKAFPNVDAKVVTDAVNLAGERLREANTQARAKRDDLRTVLTDFKLQLEEGEAKRVLLRSRR